MTAIKVTDLCYSYADHKVLHNINLSVDKGQLVSILGSNGVGKSTLFKCMLGLLKNYSGSVEIYGKDLHAMSVKEISAQIAYIPQHTAPAFNYSVEDIVLMGTSPSMGVFSEPGEREMQKVNDALERVGISHLRMRCFHMLSGGEKQLVIIARALAQNAGIIMLDEPTSSLDLGNQINVLKTVRALSREGFTIVQTTHSPEHAYMYSDKVIAIKDGCILKSGSPRDIITSEVISSLYDAEINVCSLYEDKVRVCTDTL